MNNMRRIWRHVISLVTSIILFFFCAFMLFSCKDHADVLPQKINDSFYIANRAEGINKRARNGQYYISYQIEEKYPAEMYIEDCVRVMNSKGWRRLEYDFQNNMELSHAKGEKGVWDSFVDKSGKSLFIWVEQWENQSKDIVIYALRYKGNNTSDRSTLNKLMVQGIYIPSGVRENASRKD